MQRTVCPPNLRILSCWTLLGFRSGNLYLGLGVVPPVPPSLYWGISGPTSDGESLGEDSNTASRPLLHPSIPDESDPAETVNSSLCVVFSCRLSPILPLDQM